MSSKITGYYSASTAWYESIILNRKDDCPLGRSCPTGLPTHHSYTRMHSSRMRTARTVTIRGGSPSGGFSIGGEGSPSGGFSIRGGSPLGGGVPCDLSHHAFDVTCMLPAHQLRPTNSAAAYILLVMWPAMYAGIPTPPPVERILDTRFSKYYLAPNFVCGR